MQADEPAVAARAGDAEGRGFFGAAKLIAGVTLCSRVAGLARDMILSRTFGTSRLTDAFYLAFLIPNLFRRLFGEGALSAAFVPVFSETTERDGGDSAGRLLSNVLGWLGLFLSSLCVLIELGLLATLWLGGAEWDGRAVVLLAGLMLPFMVTVCLLAVGSAALNCVRHFAYPAAAPILLNLVIITAALAAPHVATNDFRRLELVAASVTAAGVLQLGVLVWQMKRHGLPVRPRLRPVHPGVGRMLRMMGPMLLGLGVLQINALLDKLIAWVFTATPDAETLHLLGRELAKPLRPGVVTWLNYGERLYQFPLGVLAIALGTAVFPLFSRYAARNDTENLRLSVNRAIRLAIFEGLPSGVGLLLLGPLLASVLFQGGSFSGDDARQTAHVVWFYGLGMWAFCAQQILTRAFYAQKDTLTPLKVVCSMVALNFALNLTLIWVPAIRHGAFGLSTSITASLNVVILTIILRRRLGRLGMRQLAVSLARIVIATACMGGAVGWAVSTLRDMGVTSGGVQLAAGVAVGVASFVAISAALRAPEIGELLARPAKEPEAPEDV